MPYKNLTVVTTSGWVARDLRAAGTIQVTPEYGFDVPAMDGSTAIWCSGAWAMRLAKSGISHPFRSAGPAWLTRVPERFLRRSIWAGTLDQMPVQSGAQIFCKLSEHKHSAVPADLYLMGESAPPFRVEVNRLAFDPEHITSRVGAGFERTAR